MIKTSILTALVILLSMTVVFLTTVTFVEERTIYYNCDIAEFHPDIPIEVKKQCRKLRAAKRNMT